MLQLDLIVWIAHLLVFISHGLHFLGGAHVDVKVRHQFIHVIGLIIGERMHILIVRPELVLLWAVHVYFAYYLRIH